MEPTASADGAQGEPAEKPAPTADRGGRPLVYSREIFDEIIELICESDLSVRDILRSNKRFPSRWTLNRWLAKDEQLRLEYAIAIHGRAEDICFECLTIVDEAAKNYHKKVVGEGEDTHMVDDKPSVAFTQMQVDGRHWLLSKLAPKNFGDEPETVYQLPAGSLPAPTYGTGTGTAIQTTDPKMLAQHPLAREFEEWQKAGE